jgi:hypothetical protein
MYILFYRRKYKGQQVLKFIDANEDEHHQFWEQDHNINLVTAHGFHVGGKFNGSINK